MIESDIFKYGFYIIVGILVLYIGAKIVTWAVLQTIEKYHKQKSERSQNEQRRTKTKT